MAQLIDEGLEPLFKIIVRDGASVNGGKHSRGRQVRRVDIHCAHYNCVRRAQARDKIVGKFLRRLISEVADDLRANGGEVGAPDLLTVRVKDSLNLRIRRVFDLIVDFSVHQLLCRHLAFLRFRYEQQRVDARVERVLAQLRHSLIEAFDDIACLWIKISQRDWLSVDDCQRAGRDLSCRRWRGSGSRRRGRGRRSRWPLSGSLRLRCRRGDDKKNAAERGPEDNSILH